MSARTFLLICTVTLVSAAVVPELPVEQQGPIANHINHVVQEPKDKQQTASATLVGQVPPTVSVAHVHANAVAGQQVPQQVQPHVVRVINHQATAELHQHAPSQGQGQGWSQRPTEEGLNKVVAVPIALPHVPHLVVKLPGQAPVDIADKISKLQQHVSQVMQQAQTHIPQAINQAIKQQQEMQKQKQNQQQQTTTSSDGGDTTKQPNVVASKSGRALDLPLYRHNLVQVEHAPELLPKHIRQMQLGKCNFKCPSNVLPVCASNGRCVVEFDGQCELSQWNCFNAQNVFHQVHDAECEENLHCYELDMMQ